MRRYGPIAVVCALTVVSWWGLGWGTRASAAETAAKARFHLSYRAPEGCPTDADFARMVSSYLHAPWQADASQFAGILSVTVREEGSVYAAHLAMVTADGYDSLQRRNAVESCSDVVKAMAFSAADAIRIIGKSSQGGPGPKPPPVATPPLEPHWEAGIEGGREWGIGSRGAWGGAAFVGYRWPVSRWSARLGAGYWDTRWRVHEGNRNRMSLAALRADLCPPELDLVWGITIPFCASAQAGVHILLDETTLEDTTRGALRPWFSLGLLTRLRMGLGRGFVEGIGGIWFPITRTTVDRPRVDDADAPLAYETPKRAGVIAISLGCELL